MRLAPRQRVDSATLFRTSDGWTWSLGLACSHAAMREAWRTGLYVRLPPDRITCHLCPPVKR